MSPLGAENYIGLMSGTSLDGVDGVLCRFDEQGRWLGLDGHASTGFTPELRALLLGLQHSGPDELHRAALAANRLALVCASVVETLLEQCGLHASQVRAIGCHGQTVRHQPGLHDGIGYTLQLNQPALLAERCGIDVIADFRSRDVAAGGQGAPLVPPFHAALFSRDVPVGVVNIGGISNLTVLVPDMPVRGHDCGPGNALLDDGAQRHLGQPYDAEGTWSAGGHVDAALLALLQAEPYFALPAPKSTGRDLFNPGWLQQRLSVAAPGVTPRDLQAALCELTAWAIARDVLQALPGGGELLVCGGGALNADLMRRLARLLPHHAVDSTAARGLPPLQVEAAAFAWLARQHCHRVPASRVEVTGARAPRVLGACYPA